MPFSTFSRRRRQCPEHLDEDLQSQSTLEMPTKTASSQREAPTFRKGFDDAIAAWGAGYSPLDPLMMSISTMPPPAYGALYDDERPDSAVVAEIYAQQCLSQASLSSGFTGYDSGYATPHDGARSTMNDVAPSSSQAQKNATSENCLAAHRLLQGAALCDRVASRLNELIQRSEEDNVDIHELARRVSGDGASSPEPARSTDRSAKKEKASTVKTSEHAINHIINFKKSWLYANSRLPPGMLPFKAYLPTWALISRAAQTSLDVYERPPRVQRQGYFDADPKHGTKAHSFKVQELDDTKLLVVAIRGSQFNFFDWQVNLGIKPVPPTGFLDDEGNGCHAGYLQVARSMISIVAKQLRQLIEEDPSWGRGSYLLFTGHSAGGAVASLLYMHMLAKTVESDLTVLAGLFKRIHCITFGSPPVSLLPLQHPSGNTENKNVFLSFVSEGDPVVFADWEYIKSLIKLVASPAPRTAHTAGGLRERQSRQQLSNKKASMPSPPKWPVPACMFTPAGRLVLLRENTFRRPSSSRKSSGHAKLEAVQLTADELRGIVFGDIAMHPMTLYKRRLDELMFAAVTGRDGG